MDAVGLYAALPLGYPNRQQIFLKKMTDIYFSAISQVVMHDQERPQAFTTRVVACVASLADFDGCF